MQKKLNNIEAAKLLNDKLFDMRTLEVLTVDGEEYITIRPFTRKEILSVHLDDLIQFKDGRPAFTMRALRMITDILNRSETYIHIVDSYTLKVIE